MYTMPCNGDTMLRRVRNCRFIIIAGPVVASVPLTTRVAEFNTRCNLLVMIFGAGLEKT